MLKKFRVKNGKKFVLKNFVLKSNPELKNFILYFSQKICPPKKRRLQ